MKRTWKVWMSGVMTAGMLLTGSMSVQAAPQKMNDGRIFDPEYYATVNTDVVAALGTQDPAAMYQHYKTSGKAEGRLPYDPKYLNTSGYPNFPAGRPQQYYVIYNAMQEQRVEMAIFDMYIPDSSNCLNWKSDCNYYCELVPRDPGNVYNVAYYYLQGGKWIFFKDGATNSNNVSYPTDEKTGIIASNLDVNVYGRVIPANDILHRDINGLINVNYDLDTTFPAYPAKDTNHFYAIYRDSFNNDRIELATFDMQIADYSNSLKRVRDMGMDYLYLQDQGNFTSSNCYYIDHGKWVRFWSGTSRITDGVTQVLASNLDYYQGGCLNMLRNDIYGLGSGQ